MSILIFTQHFPPETAATGRRASDLAETLSNRGHDVTVIAGRPNHPSSLGQPFCRDAPREEYAQVGCRILRVPIFRSADQRKRKRLLTYATFMLSAAWRGMRQPRPDAIIAISPLPTGLAALLAHWRHRAPLVFDLQDIWPESALALGVIQQSWLIRLLRRVERFLYRHCSAVVGISEGFKRYLLTLGVPPERTAVIHNGVDWRMFVGVPPKKELRQTPPFARRFVVGYIGNIGLAQRLDTVIEAAERLRDEAVAFLLMGEGVEKQRLEILARDLALENVQFLDGVPRHRVPSVLAACDALLVILRDEPVFKVTIPSKIYEYMAAGKPILCSVGGEAAALVVDAGCGLPVSPSDGKSLADAIRKLLREPQLCRAMGDAGAASVRTHFARSSLMQTYADLVDGLSGKKRPWGCPVEDNDRPQHAVGNHSSQPGHQTPRRARGTLSRAYRAKL